MDITFDEAKRRKTLAERQLDFNEAATVFAGFHLTRTDDRFAHGEARLVTIGMLGVIVVVIVSTERGDSRRIISMRKADRDERRYYEERLERSR